jgi:hypothetical protein
MLRALAEHIRTCQRQAAECREKANEIANAAADLANTEIKAAYLDMENRWIQLAQNYEYVESLERLLLDSQKSKDTEPPG